MTAVPSLSTEGWLESVDKKADRLLAHYLLSERSQSVLYHGKIKSVPYLVATYGNNTLDLQDKIGEGLYDLFSPYFDDLSYEVTVEEDKDNTAALEIKISATVTERGVNYDLAFLIDVKDSKVNTFAKLNNG